MVGRKLCGERHCRGIDAISHSSLLAFPLSRSRRSSLTNSEIFIHKSNKFCEFFYAKIKSQRGNNAGPCVDLFRGGLPRYSPFPFPRSRLILFISPRLRSRMANKTASALASSKDMHRFQEGYIVARRDEGILDGGSFPRFAQATGSGKSTPLGDNGQF